MNWGKRLIIALLAMLLSACAAVKPIPGNPPINQINNTLQTSIANNKVLNADGQMALPSNVESALVPNMLVKKQTAKSQEQRFNVAVSDVPAKTFFMGLVQGTKYNMIVSPKISGTITLNLKNVTIPEALEAAHDIYGYEYKTTPFGFQILPGGLQTRIFTVNYINVDRSGTSETSISSGQLTNNSSTTEEGETSTTTSTGEAQQSSNVKTETKADFWAELTETLKLMIGDKDGERVVVNPDAGLVVVRAYPKELSEVAQYIDQLQNSMSREVIIDAKILEVDLFKGYQSGINWNLLTASQTALGPDNDGEIDETGNPDLNSALKAFTNVFALNLTSAGANFSAAIKLLSTQGNVQVLSSPRITTMNNQKAVIKVGKDEYFITNVSNSTTSSSSTTDTQDVDLTPFFSGIALDVTPEIAADGSVILHIHPIVSRVQKQQLKYTINSTDQDIPSALSTIRESDSIVRAKSGQVVVIGGLMENRAVEANGSTPFLDKTPVVGPLFRRTNQQSEKTELVILLKPIVIKQGSWNKELTKNAKQMRDMNEGFHFGSHPHRFGNLGENFIQGSSKEKTVIKTPVKKPVYSK